MLTDKKSGHIFSWLIKSGFVSVGYTPQTTESCVCCRHVDNDGPTHRRHSVKSAFFCRQSRVREPYPGHTFLRAGRNWYYTFLVCAMSLMHAGIRFFCCKEHYFVRGTHQFSGAHNLKNCFLVSWRFIPLRRAHTIKIALFRQRIRVHTVRRQFLNV